jgi:hypothetical protein
MLQVRDYFYWDTDTHMVFNGSRFEAKVTKLTHGVWEIELRSGAKWFVYSWNGIVNEIADLFGVTPLEF